MCVCAELGERFSLHLALLFIVSALGAAMLNLANTLMASNPTNDYNPDRTKGGA